MAITVPTDKREHNPSKQRWADQHGSDKPKCTVEGCNRPGTHRGYCVRHYHGWNKKGTPHWPDMTKEERAEYLKTGQVPERCHDTGKNQHKPEPIKIKAPDPKPQPKPQPKADDCPKHPCWDEMILHYKMRKPCLLIGPSGPGKSYTTELMAKHLGVPFRSLSCSPQMSNTEIVGSSAIRKGMEMVFCSTGFIEMAENGGIFCLDEGDSNDEVLLVLNNFLENGMMELTRRPDNPILKKHPDFHIVMTANTDGTGATREYSSRAKLDRSTLDRFQMGTMKFDYCRKIEQWLWNKEAGPGKQHTLDELWRIRDEIKRNNLEDRIVSTRFIKNSAEYVGAANWTKKQVIDKLTITWGKDEKQACGIR